MKNLKVFETFSGIGAQHKALENINVPYEIVGTSDWDINAIISYDIIHNGNIISSEQLIKELKKHGINNDDDMYIYIKIYFFEGWKKTLFIR